MAADQKCIATALRDSPSVEYDGASRPAPFTLKRGERIEPSQYWPNEAQGRPTFCVRGDYCYLAADFAIEGNCKSGQIVQRP